MAGEHVEGAHVRRLEERDIDAAIALTNLENWGYTRADFRRLLALSPAGCFVAESRGRVVGVLTTTSYNGLAFLGAVIVHPELRGQGMGKAMMEAALSHLSAAGVRTVRLNAYLHAIPFYERLGFQGEYEVGRWHGPAWAGRRRAVRPARRADLEAIAQFDAAYFGANRLPLLERLEDEFPSTFLVAEHRGAIRG
ncbi:MAG: GNAT family N-acetyltransferase, partial [Thermoplasmata archaeon]